MPALPIQAFHSLFGMATVISFNSMLFVRYFFSLQSWPFLHLLFVFIVFEAIVVYIFSCIFCNLMMFAFHGDPLSIGQKKKWLAINTKCDNHENCRETVNNVFREGVKNKPITYTYDEKHHFHGPVDSDIVKESTTIVFFHGNGCPACCFNWWATIVTFRYPNVNVVMYEYPGYGKRGLENISTGSLAAVRQEIAVDWTYIATKFGSNSIIAAGLSLGGGFSWSTVDMLDPPPKQLVLMNTFADLSLFLEQESKFYFPFLKFLAPKAMIDYRISKVTVNKYKGDVLVVCTQDDELFPLEHAAVFKKYFKDEMKLNYEEVVLPSGGHNESLAKHGKMWLDKLRVV